MKKSELIFRTIDRVLHVPQNYKSYPDINVVKNIVYDDNYPKFDKGDLYYSKHLAENEKHPVLLNIHGGGYVAGDKRHRRSFCSHFANKGWYVFNINHRLSPLAPFPLPVADCLTALNFLAVLAEEYNIDLDKVVVTGDSSGAYFASYLVAASVEESIRTKLELPEPKVKIAGLASFSGPYDIMVAIQTKVPFGLIRDIGECFLGMSLNKDFSNLEDYPYLKEIGVTDHVSQKWCPTFLSYSEHDILCKGQGELLEQKLKDAGVPVWTHKSTKPIDNHCYHLDMYKPVSKACLTEAERFLEYIKTK